MRGHINKTGGFTLLELMISIALLAVVAVIVGAGMRLGYRTVHKGEKKADDLQRLRVSLTIINSQIQSSVPLTYEEDAEKRYYFEGSGESLKLATNYSIWGGQKGYVIVEYHVQTDEKGMKTLYARENTVGVEGQRETKLLQGFKTIDFEYFSKDITEEEGSWVKEWTDTTAMPPKIKLHIALGDKEDTLIIPIRAVNPNVLPGGVPKGDTPPMESWLRPGNCFVGYEVLPA
jgi:prepilin-type N-terminal cleavage/methylation domain-containing protein